jgi:hypothetical protein
LKSVPLGHARIKEKYEELEALQAQESSHKLHHHNGNNGLAKVTAAGLLAMGASLLNVTNANNNSGMSPSAEVRRSFSNAILTRSSSNAVNILAPTSLSPGPGVDVGAGTSYFDAEKYKVRQLFVETTNRGAIHGNRIHDGNFNALMESILAENNMTVQNNHEGSRLLTEELALLFAGFRRLDVDGDGYLYPRDILAFISKFTDPFHAQKQEQKKREKKERKDKRTNNDQASDDDSEASEDSNYGLPPEISREHLEGSLWALDDARAGAITFMEIIRYFFRVRTQLHTNWITLDRHIHSHTLAHTMQTHNQHIDLSHDYNYYNTYHNIQDQRKRSRLYHQSKSDVDNGITFSRMPESKLPKAKKIDKLTTQTQASTSKHKDLSLETFNASPTLMKFAFKQKLQDDFVKELHKRSSTNRNFNRNKALYKFIGDEVVNNGGDADNNSGGKRVRPHSAPPISSSSHNDNNNTNRITDMDNDNMMETVEIKGISSGELMNIPARIQELLDKMNISEPLIMWRLLMFVALADGNGLVHLLSAYEVRRLLICNEG